MLPKGDEVRYILLVLSALTTAIMVAYGVDATTNAQAAGSPAKHEPPDGYVYLGVDADQQPGDTVETSKSKWDQWTALMGGKPHTISHTFEGFDTWFGFDFDIATARGATPLLTWQTGGVSPRTIAQAENAGTNPTDQIILQNAKLSADFGKPVFLRVDQEMNAHWFEWSAYNRDGSRRASGTDDFRNMWRRMAIIFRGGKVKDVNAQLASLGLPPLDTDARFPEWMGIPSVSDPEAYLKPAPNVAFVFNPVDAPGIPDVAGNRWLDYYPGDEYVDWVGQTTYNVTWNASMEQRFRWLEAFYQEFSVRRGKPYMMGEWGVAPKAGSGYGDNSAYVREMLDWARRHPKVKALVYFSVNQADSDDLRLSSYPNSAEALSAGIQQAGSSGGFRLFKLASPPSDTLPPDTSIASGPSGTTTSTSASFGFAASEPTQRFECSLDGTAFAPCASPKSFTGLSSRTHVFRVRAVDRVGNVDATPASRTWTVDVVRPTVGSMAPASRTRDRTPLVGAIVSDSQSNLAKANVALYVDGRKKTTFSYDAGTDRLRYASGRLAYGTHTVKIVARDAQGLTTSRAWSFRVVR